MDDETVPRRHGRGLGLSGRGAAVAISFGLLAGGFAGGFLVSHAATSGSSSSSSTSTGATGSGSGTGSAGAAAPDGGPSMGVFHPNEDPTHETGESAAREAQENAGQRPTAP